LPALIGSTNEPALGQLGLADHTGRQLKTLESIEEPLVELDGGGAAGQVDRPFASAVVRYWSGQ
jgi:hypothetical protein